MKQPLAHFDFWENFIIEKQIVDVFRNFVGHYKLDEIQNNYNDSFDKIQEALRPLIGFDITVDVFHLKNIWSQIRVARNALDNFMDDSFICGGDVYYYIIRESADKQSIYLSYQWHSLFHELVTILDGQPRTRGLAKEKLFEVIRKQFPQAQRLLFEGATEGTMKMFKDDGICTVQGDKHANYYIAINPTKRPKICSYCGDEARVMSTKDHTYYCDETCFEKLNLKL